MFTDNAPIYSNMTDNVILFAGECNSETISCCPQSSGFDNLVDYDTMELVEILWKILLFDNIHCYIFDSYTNIVHR